MRKIPCHRNNAEFMEAQRLICVGSVLSVAGPVIGGLLNSNASSDAANTQQQSTQQSIDEQRREYDTSRADLAPFRQSGLDALTLLKQKLGLAPAVGNTYTDPTGGVLGTAGFKLQFTPNGWADMNGNLEPDSIANRIPNSGVEGPLSRKFSIADFWNDPVVQASYQSGLDLGTKALKERMHR
jgi:type II secretory pathway pseudopilin PulG